MLTFFISVLFAFELKLIAKGVIGMKVGRAGEWICLQVRCFSLKIDPWGRQGMAAATGPHFPKAAEQSCWG